MILEDGGLQPQRIGSGQRKVRGGTYLLFNKITKLSIYFTDGWQHYCMCVLFVCMYVSI